MLDQKVKGQGATSPLVSATVTTRSPLAMMSGLAHPGRFGNPVTKKK